MAPADLLEERVEFAEIDDEYEISNLLSDAFLTDMNASLQQFADPGEFLRRTPSGYDTRVVVYDLMFPHEYDVTAGLNRIAELREALPETLIIVYTASPLEDVRRKAKERGADAVVQKSRDNPETIRDLIRLARGREVVRARALCEVVEVDEDGGRVRVEIPGRDGWVAEKAFDINFCPQEACQIGGTFWVETLEKRGANGIEYAVRARSVDRAEEEEFLAEFPE